MIEKQARRVLNQQFESPDSHRINSWGWWVEQQQLLSIENQHMKQLKFFTFFTQLSCPQIVATIRSGKVQDELIKKEQFFYLRFGADVVDEGMTWTKQMGTHVC